MQGIRRFTEWITTLFTVGGGASLVVMTLIACLNMCMRLLGKPLAPAYELVSYLGAVTVALPLGYAQLKKSHIKVDILSTRFPVSLRKITTGISLVISAAFFSIAAGKVGQHAANFCRTGELSETTRMAFYPFTYVVAVFCSLLAFCLLVDLVTLFSRPSGEDQ
jgi:TRAP-type C4-dicarboxylate transport system permease small subunit